MDVLWQELYKAAMLELDRVRLSGRIEAAHAAMQQRMMELSKNNHDGIYLDEQQAIFDALSNLRTLQRVELKSSSQSSRQAQTCKPQQDGI
jgi:hypothetical protein